VLIGVGIGLLLLDAAYVVVRSVRAAMALQTVGPGSRPALALIESRRATSGEGGDIPVAFDLTVAPDGAPAYRVKITQTINLVDIPDYQPRRLVVVDHHPDRPWQVRINTRPTPEWVRRAAEDAVDSAPESTLATKPDQGSPFCLLSFLGILLGGAVIVVLFRGDLFKDDASTVPPPAATTTSSTTSSTTTWSSTYSYTVTLP
jgi:hypothetical protein